MQRIFEHGDIQNIILALDKELNILIYRLPFYVIIYGIHFYKLYVFWHTVYFTNDHIE